MFAATFFIGATLWVLIHTWVDAKLGILPPVRNGTLAGALRAFRRSLEFDPQRPQNKRGLRAALTMPVQP